MYRELRTHGKDEVTPEEAEEGARTGRPKTVTAAVWQVAMADLSMSLDNVLAVAGAAKDHLEVLVAGLVISIVMMALAANLIAKLIHKHRWLAWVGLTIIAYVALETGEVRRRALETWFRTGWAESLSEESKRLLLQGSRHLVSALGEVMESADGGDEAWH